MARARARVRVRVRVGHARRASGCSLHRLRLQVGPGAARFKAEIHFNPQLLSEKCAPLTTYYLLLTTYSLAAALGEVRAEAL